MNDRQRAELYRRLAATNPEPATELIYGSPFELLVAVVLSAQATDVSVNKATAELFRAARTPAAMLKLGEAGLRRYIRAIGLFNTKGKNLIAASRMLVEQHAGQVPATREALEALPGVGRKSANVILNTAFGQPTIAVDTHIFRVANRTGLAPGKTVRAVEERLLEATPDEYRQNAHQWLVLHGRYICKARRPECPHCVIASLCEYPDKTTEARDLPGAARNAQVHGQKKQRSAAIAGAPRGRLQRLGK
jgi:endonuclease-3